MDTKQLMQLGARARLKELEDEKGELMKLLSGTPASAPAEGKPGRKPMSAASRKKLSARLKAYWADRKANPPVAAAKKK